MLHLFTFWGCTSVCLPALDIGQGSFHVLFVSNVDLVVTRGYEWISSEDSKKKTISVKEFPVELKLLKNNNTLWHHNTYLIRDRTRNHFQTYKIHDKLDQVGNVLDLFSCQGNTTHSHYGSPLSF